jgi:hypothetical protein
MANPSKRQQPRTSQLFLEAFERRDLLSGTHFLLDPLLSLQTSARTPEVKDREVTELQILKSISIIDILLAGTTTPASVDGHSQPLPTDTTSAVHGTTAVAGGTAIPASTSTTSDSTLTTSGAGSIVNPTDTSSTTDPLSVVTPASVQHYQASVVNPVVAEKHASATHNNPQDQQSQATSTTTDEGSMGQGDDSQPQASGEAKTGAADLVESYLSDTTNNGERAGGYTLPSDNAVAASSAEGVTLGTPISLSPTVQMNGTVGGTVPSTGRMGAGDTAGHGAIRGPVADVRAAIVQDFYFSIVQDTSRSRTNSDATLNHRSPDVSPLLLSKARSAETELDHVGLPSDRQGILNKAFTGIDWNLPAAPARSGRESPVEVVAADIVFGGAGRLKEDNSGAGERGDEDEVTTSPVTGSTRGAGLLGSPLLFDLDSLAQEAQKFLGQIEQMGDDLAGMLGRTNLLSGLVAIGVAVSALQVARRRKQRAAHGIVLQGGTEKTFTCYPEVGGTWTWEES